MTDETPAINGKAVPPEAPKRRGRPLGVKNAPKVETLTEQSVSG